MPTPIRLQWLDRCLLYYQQTHGETMPIDVWNIHMQILQEHECSWGCGVPYGFQSGDYENPTIGRPYTILDNCSVEIFQELITEFCTWLDDKGERDKPVIITEYGVLMPSEYLGSGDPDNVEERRENGGIMVVDFMQGTFEYMLHTTHPELGWAAVGGRLIQRWAWFSLNVPLTSYNGWLYNWQDTPPHLTVFGETYRDCILSQ